MATGELNHVIRRLRSVLVKGDAAELPDRDLLTRYVRHRDEAAFEALVRRHGPMVMGVCRRVLANPHDADDAFQATFLVLVRKAATLRSPGLIGNWLYGVAYRTALEARTAAARRRAKEASMTPRAETTEQTWAELRQVLDSELERLPANYRAVLVLCDLEGKTRKEAAQYLGWPEGSVAGRLARARTLLAARLTKRGISLSGGVLAMLLVEHASARVSASVLAATVAFRGLPTAGAIPPRIAALTDGVLKSMLVSKLQAGAVLLLTLGLLVVGAGLAAQFSPSPLAGEGRGGGDEASEAPPPHPDPPPPGGREQERTDHAGDPLPADALARLGTVRFRHGGSVTALAFTPDGKQLVSHGWDGVRLWNAATGRETGQVLPGRDGWIGAAFLMPDGKTVVTMEQQQNGNVIRLRELGSLKVVREYPVGYLQTPRLSPDGKLLAGFLDNNTTVEIWDMAEGKKLRSWKAHEKYCWCCEFAADSKTLVTGGPDGTIRFWDTATGVKQREITGHPNVVGKLALSSDGKLLATLGMTEVKTGDGAYFPWDNLLRVWDVASGKELHQLTMPFKKGFNDHPQGFSHLTFAPDGKTLVSAGQDDMLRFWDAVTGKELRHVPRSSRGAVAMTFSPDGKTLAVAAIAIRLLDVASGKDVVPLVGHRQNVFATAVTPDGRTIVTAGGDGTVTLWDGTTGRERRRLDVHEERITALHMTSDGRRLLTTGLDKTVRVWELATGKELRRLDAAQLEFGLLAVSADGQKLVVPAKENSFALIDLDTDKEVVKLGNHDAAVRGAAFHPDGRTLIVWCDDHTAHVWDLVTRRQLRQFEFADPPPERGLPAAPVGAGGRTGWSYDAALSPDGRLLAYGSQGRYLALHETATGKEVQLLRSLPDGPSAVAFSPDSRMLAWGGWRDPIVHLVEVATGKERHQLAGHKGRVLSLTFTADGKTLISGDEDTTALVWDLTGKLGSGSAWERPPSEAELDACWTSLADADATKAYEAMRRLAASPTEAVPYLQKKLPPVAPVDEKRLAGLIADLDSDTFAVRDNAYKELERLGEAATAACQKALAGTPSAEVRRRLEALLEAQAQAWRAPSPDRVRMLRIVELLELAATAEARTLLELYAAGAPEARLTVEAKGSLKRLKQLAVGP